MKLCFKLMWVMAFIAVANCFIPAQASVQFSTVDDPVYYQIVFARGGFAIEDQGAGANLRTADSDYGSDSQLWQLIGREDSLVLRSKLGNYIHFNGSRFAASTEPATLRVVRRGSFYQIGRIGSELTFNQWGGLGSGREIGEYNSADIGNNLVFYDALGNEVYLDDEKVDVIEVALETPGTLGVELLNKVDVLADVKRLKIIGTFNSADWATISNLANLYELDMSEVLSETIPDGAFQRKSSLRSVKLPRNAAYIGQSAFVQTVINQITIPASVTNIASQAFSGVTRLQYVEFELNSKLNTISSSAFYNCSGLKRIHIPEGCTLIQSSAFKQCTNLRELTLPSTLKTIGYEAFYQTNSLRELVFPEGLESIGSNAFAYSGLTSIILPAGLTELENYAFSRCSSATTIQLPSYISQYNRNFEFCTSVKEVICPAVTPPTYSSEPFYGVNNRYEVTLTVPDFAVASYKLDSYWMQFGNIQGGAQVSLYYVAGPLSLTNDRRINGAPDVTVLANGSITLGGQAPQQFGNLVFEHNFSNSSSYTFSQFINNSPLVGAKKLTNKIYLNANTWYFITPIINIVRSKISHSDASAAFAIRRYSGQRRAENGSGGWANLADDETLESGKGYIIQTNKTGWMSVDLEVPNSAVLAEILRLRSGDITMPLEDWPAEITANAGWNFLGNPYSSHFDTHFLDFPAPITVYDPANRNYRAYSLADDNFVLKPMQPFFVQKPDGVDNVTFLKNGRQLSATPNTSAYKVKGAEPSSRVICNVSIKGNDLEDATRVVVNPTASLDYEPNCDAAKMMSNEKEALQLWSVGEGNIPMAINERPMENGYVNLAMTVPSAGEYELSVDSEDQSVSILDRQTSQVARCHVCCVDEAKSINDRYALVIEGATSGLSDTVRRNAVLVSGHSVTTEVESVIYAIDGRVVNRTKANVPVILPSGLYVAKGIDGSVVKFYVNVESK